MIYAKTFCGYICGYPNSSNLLVLSAIFSCTFAFSQSLGAEYESVNDALKTQQLMLEDEKALELKKNKPITKQDLLQRGKKLPCKFLIESTYTRLVVQGYFYDNAWIDGKTFDTNAMQDSGYLSYEGDFVRHSWAPFEANTKPDWEFDTKSGVVFYRDYSTIYKGSCTLIKVEVTDVKGFK